MGRKEKELINKVLLEGSKKGRMFRANSGMAWIGKIIKKLNDRIVLQNPRPFHGMPKGTPDCIGWENVEICEWLNENMEKHPCLNYKNKKNDKTPCVLCPLNKKIAIFKSVEIKTGKQKLTSEQENFKSKLLEDGGIYEERRE